MDIEKLIERLRELSGTDNLSEFDDAATAISTLQTEAEGMRSNWYKSVEKIKELRAELEQARESLDFARTKDAEIVRLGKELEQAKAEITRLKHYEDKCHDCPIVCAKTEIIKAHEELEAVQAELEQKSKLIAQQAAELERRDKLLKEQETELDQMKRENETLKHALQNWHEEV